MSHATSSRRTTRIERLLTLAGPRPRSLTPSHGGATRRAAWIPAQSSGCTAAEGSRAVDAARRFDRKKPGSMHGSRIGARSVRGSGRSGGSDGRLIGGTDDGECREGKREKSPSHVGLLESRTKAAWVTETLMVDRTDTAEGPFHRVTIRSWVQPGDAPCVSRCSRRR